MIREVEGQLKLKALSQKKISKANDGIESIVGLIDYVNNFMGEDDVEIWPGHTVEDVLIPREFADFVYPASIRYNAADRRTENLLFRDKPDTLNVPIPMSYTKYIQDCDAFRGNFKKDAVSDMVSVASLRKHVSLADVISRISVNGRVNYYSNNFVPIPVRDIGVLFTDRYFNDTADAVLQDYIADIRFNS